MVSDNILCPDSESSYASSIEKFTNSFISAPATNALSPAPVIIISLTSGFATDDLTAWSSSEKVSIFNAFKFFGRFIEIILILLSISYIRLL